MLHVYSCIWSYCVRNNLEQYNYTKMEKQGIRSGLYQFIFHACGTVFKKIATWLQHMMLDSKKAKTSFVTNII